MDIINAIVLLLNYIFVPALSYGSQLALGAIFVSLIYGILRFAYFTAGDLMSFGTMFTILFTWYFQSLGISLGILPTALLAIPFGIIITILYVLLKDKLVFTQYSKKNTSKVLPKLNYNSEMENMIPADLERSRRDLTKISGIHIFERFEK